MNQRPTLLTLTTLLATITFVSSLWAFLHCKTQPVMDFITMFLYNSWELSWKNHHSSSQNSPIWWYLGSMSTWKNLKCTQSDVFQLETAACLFHSSSSIIHSVSPPSLRSTALLPLLAPSDLLKAVQTWAQVYVWECVCICVCMYMLCFVGRGKLKKEELSLFADRKTKIINIITGFSIRCLNVGISSNSLPLFIWRALNSEEDTEEK